MPASRPNGSKVNPWSAASLARPMVSKEMSRPKALPRAVLDRLTDQATKTGTENTLCRGVKIGKRFKSSIGALPSVSTDKGIASWHLAAHHRPRKRGSAPGFRSFYSQRFRLK